MHLPDGMLAGHAEVITGAVAAGGVVVAARAARHELAEVSAGRVAAVTSLVFALQMVNFPVAQGTSGHLMGAALAVVLLGPGLGVLSVTGVLTLQALLFADGGLSSLGANVVNMALVPGAVAWTVFRRTDRVALAAFVSVLAASLAFSVEYALGGLGDADVLLVGRDMLGVHLLIALGAAAITTLVVWADRRWEPRPAAVVAGALGLAVLVAPWASPNPDGLERVAIDRGFASLAAAPDLVTPFVDYTTSGVGQPQLTVALAGLVGVALAGAVAFGFAGAWRTGVRERRAGVES